MRDSIRFATHRDQELVDITAQVRLLVERSGIRDGLVHVYAQGSTAAIMIQENWDESVQEDVITFLAKQIPKGIWQHDRQDGNGDAHIKAGLVGPGETLPLMEGKLGLSTWQNIFFCEFDGPRSQRNVVVTIIADL
ncbi:MAG: secondary thiamine-phosphate synthase enzyme YjbQ [Chromatiaceae bacterium]